MCSMTVLPAFSYFSPKPLIVYFSFATTMGFPIF